MPKKLFVRNEEWSRSGSLVELNLRLFRSLPLFIRLVPFTICAILLSSAAPSVFRWYAGRSISDGARFTFEGLILILSVAVMSRILAWVLFEASGMWSSQGLYASMIQGLTRVRVTFFDENPSGRIMNRLIRDYDEVRSTAIIFVGDFFNAIIEILSVAGVACFASPWAALAIFPLLVIFFFIQSQRSVMIEHCRGLSALASSHLLNRKTDLIEGREIYVLYGKSSHLFARMMESLRVYLQGSAWTMWVDAWASFWIRFFAEIFSLIVLLFLVGALENHQVEAPIVGVIVSALFGIAGSVGWLDFATSLISRSVPHLRRVFEFIDLSREDTGELAPSVSLTKSGEAFSQIQNPLGDIVFVKYSMSYREGLPLILKNLELRIRGGSKVVFVGRTGAGKSSIIQALFRMVHVEGGDILLGDESILNMNLSVLRSQFGVVPQFPYLFAGTLKSNLDRMGQITNQKLKEALSSVGLDYSLDFHVVEGGMNLSLGERQLICLARVIACERSIILMDEPTSGLDPQTDFRIHRILRTALKDKTVLTIAHRRESLDHYDSIVEMDAGRVVGIHTPDSRRA